MPTKIVIFIFLREQKWFLRVFQLFTASVLSRPPGPPAVPGVFDIDEHLNNISSLYSISVGKLCVFLSQAVMWKANLSWVLEMLSRLCHTLLYTIFLILGYLELSNTKLYCFEDGFNRLRVGDWGWVKKTVNYNPLVGISCRSLSLEGAFALT